MVEDLAQATAGGGWVWGGWFTLAGALSVVALTHISKAKQSRTDRAHEVSRQQSDRASERADQKRERIRQVYAEWVGALLKETHLVGLFINMQEQEMGAGEVAMNALNAGQQENIAFAKVMLIDGDKKRTKDAHEVRAPLKGLLVDSPTTDRTKALEQLTEVAERQGREMSRFLGRVCDELD